MMLRRPIARSKDIVLNPVFGEKIVLRAIFVFSILLLFLSFLVAKRSYANGWEHGAIQYEALVEALEFNAPEIRMQAAHSLGVRGQPEAVQPLIDRLYKPEENPLVRSAIYIALGRLGGRRSIPVLTDCLSEESREELRGDCATSLGMIGEASTILHLTKALQEDASLLVQSRAVDALGDFKDKTAVQALVGVINRAGSRSMVQRAIRALGRTGSQAAVNPLLQALSASRTDSDRLLVVSALTTLKPVEAAKPLNDLLNRTDDPQLRTRIVIALGAIRARDSYPVLIKMLKDKIPAVRFFSIKSLHDLGRQEAAIPISNLSLEISRRFEKYSIEELLTDTESVLAELNIQVIALQAITDLDAPRGLQAMLNAARPQPISPESAAALKLMDAFYRQHWAALYGLGYTRSRTAFDFLTGPAGMGNPDFRLRAVATRAIGVLGFSSAAKKVIVSLNDPAAEVRWTAANVLGLLGNAVAVAPLLEALSDKHFEVRRQAAMSLGYLKNDVANEALKRIAAEDVNKNVRTAAAYSLQLLEK